MSYKKSRRTNMRIDTKTMRAAAIEALEVAGLKPVRAKEAGHELIWAVDWEGRRQSMCLITAGRADDRWIGRNTPPEDRLNYWNGLTNSNIAAIAAVATDGKSIEIHVMGSDDLIAKFEEARAARIKAGYQSNPGKPIFIAMDDGEDRKEVDRAGGNIIAVAKLVAKVELDEHGVPVPTTPKPVVEQGIPGIIADARAKIAAQMGVPVERINLTLEFSG